MRLFERIKELLLEERLRWFGFVPVLFAVGIGFYFALSFEPSLWITLIVIEGLLAAAYFLRFYPAGLFVIAALGFVVLGFASIQLRAHTLFNGYKFYDNEKMYLTGRIANIDFNHRGMPRLLLENVKDFDGNALKGTIRLTLTSKKRVPEAGKCVEMIGALRAPMKPVIAGGFDFGRKHFFDGLGAIGYSTSRALEVDCEGSHWLEGLRVYVHNVRMHIVARIHAVLPPEEAGIAAAIVAGDVSGISQEIYDHYRDSGLAHFLCIAGLHMGLVAAFVFFTARFALVLFPPVALKYDTKKIAVIPVIAMSFVYLLISGAAIPAQRAFIMTLIVLVGVLFSRKAVSIKSIAWAALIILIVSPQVLIGVSFQMSFAAVVCLIAFYEKGGGMLSRFFKSRRLPWGLRAVLVHIVGILAVSLVAGLATLPFIIYHFKRVAMYGMLGNVLAMPIIGLIIMPAVVLSLLALPFGLEYYPLKAAGFGIGKVNEITAYVAGLPAAEFRVPGMPAWGLMLIAFGGLWLCLWSKRWRHLGWIGIVIGALSLMTVKTPDVIVGEKTFAVKDNYGQMVVMPMGRGAGFERDIWLEATASQPLDKARVDELKSIFKGKMVNKAWVDLSCDKSTCEYKGLILNKDNPGEPRSIWQPDRVVTVKEYMGNRLWVKH